MDRIRGFVATGVVVAFVFVGIRAVRSATVRIEANSAKVTQVQKEINTNLIPIQQKHEKAIPKIVETAKVQHGAELDKAALLGKRLDLAQKELMHCRALQQEANLKATIAEMKAVVAQSELAKARASFAGNETKLWLAVNGVTARVNRIEGRDKNE